MRRSFRVLAAGLFAVLFASVPAAPDLLLAEDRARRDFALYMQGKFLFERNCVLCHGPRGDGRGEMAAELVPRPRSFREGVFKFRTTPFGALPTDEDLRHTIRSGLSNTGMPMFGHLREEDIEALVAYVKSFSRAWRQEKLRAEPMIFPQIPGWLEDKTELPARVARGGRHFATHCASCHGPEGEGDGPAAEGLMDLWGHAALPSNLRHPHLRDGGRPGDLYRLLATGLNGTPMVSFDEILTPEERWEIIAWILDRRLPAPATLGGSPPRPAQVEEREGEEP